MVFVWFTRFDQPTNQRHSTAQHLQAAAWAAAGAPAEEVAQRVQRGRPQDGDLDEGEENDELVGGKYGG